MYSLNKTKFGTLPSDPEEAPKESQEDRRRQMLTNQKYAVLYDA